MALRGEGGIDPFFFGTGFNGDVSFGADTDLTGIGDGAFRNLNIAKASGGDPDFTVIWPGSRIFATRSIYIGPGATLFGGGTNGASGGGGAAGGAGGVGVTMGGGYVGGEGGYGLSSIPEAGFHGTNTTASIGGAGGAGGSCGAGAAGGAGGTQTRGDFMGGEQNWLALVRGACQILSTTHTFMGGAGGGGGGANGPSIGSVSGGGGGGGGSVLLLAAPTIQIDGLLSVKGGKGGLGTGISNGGGGGGGGGGSLILIYGKLIVNGSVLTDGGDGADGVLGFGLGGFGGAGGFLFSFGGTEETTYVSTGANGVNGAHAG